MAKIDISTIEGFADMSPEEQVKALTEYEMPEPDYTGYVKKDQFDKTASEAAKYKKQLKEQMSADDQKAQEHEELVEQMKQELDELRKEKTVSQYKAQYLAQGYDEKLAEDTAQALASGDMDKVFANSQKFLEGYQKTVKAQQLLGDGKKPESGTGTPKTDYQKLYDEAASPAEQAYYMRLMAQQEQEGKN